MSQFYEWKLIIEQKLESIHYDIREIFKHVHSLEANRVEQQEAPTLQFYYEAELSIALNILLVKFDKKLANETNIENLAKTLATAGGSTLTAATYHIMNKLLTNEVSILYSRVGKKGKLSFEALNVFKSVERAI